MQDIWTSIIDYVSPEWPQAASDLCLVFGTRHGVDQFTQEIGDRYKERCFDRILVSGGATRGQEMTEADILHDSLIKMGVPSEVILLEREATNTLDNVVFSKALADRLGLDVATISILGKISSMRRYAMTVKRNWPDVQIASAYPVNIFDVERRDWFQDVAFRDRVLGELGRIPVYQKRGHIEEITVGES